MKMGEAPAPEERPAVIKAIEVAREHGDLSENAEYHAARDRPGFIEGRLAGIEDMISQADVIDPKTLSGKIVRFGATIKLAMKTLTRSACKSWAVMKRMSSWED